MRSKSGAEIFFPSIGATTVMWGVAQAARRLLAAASSEPVLRGTPTAPTASSEPAAASAARASATGRAADAAAAAEPAAQPGAAAGPAAVAAEPDLEVVGECSAGTSCYNLWQIALSLRTLDNNTNDTIVMFGVGDGARTPRTHSGG